MALVREDCVVETTTTTGTGALALAGPVTGFRSFSSVCSVNDTCYYLIEAIDGSGNRTGEWESGFGTYSSADTLTRTTVYESSNAGAAVSLSAGTKRVMICLTAAATAHRGALVYKASNLNAQNFTTAAAVTWDTENYDTHAFHDTSSNTSRLTIPTGVCSRVRVEGQITLSGLTADNWVMLAVYKNGSASWTGAGIRYHETGQTAPSYKVESAIVTVAAGDYFELYIQTESDTSVDIVAATSWFQLEVIE